MKLTKTTIGGRQTIRLEGRFDFATHREFRHAMKESIADERVREIQLDLSGVEYVDSSALGMLLLSRENCVTAGKALMLANARGTVKEVLRIANFDQLFTITHGV